MSTGKEILFPDKFKIGYINGESSRVNEKTLDSHWIGCLGEYAGLVKIPPVALMKLFDGTIQEWHDRLPGSLENFAHGLAKLCDKYCINVFYLNIPSMVPYVLWARNMLNLDLQVIFFGHSVASEFWLKLWLSAAPAIKPSDILLCSTQSCKTAMLNISGRYKYGHCIPYSVRLDKKLPEKSEKKAGNILSIGRIEDVKNIDFLLHCFAEIKTKKSNSFLTVAGEYTGKNRPQMQGYQKRIEELVRTLQLGSSVKFTGPVFGRAKDQCFQEACFLVNFSTDPAETFGYNLIEAKMWGLPVVCTRWNGFKEVLDEFNDGIFIDCRWDEKQPSIDRRQAAEACIRLLSDEALYEKLKKGALLNSSKYNYQSIIPQVLKIIIDSKSITETQNCDAIETAMTPIQNLPGIYRLEKLQALELKGETPFSILLKDYKYSLEDWMTMVKPIISHFI